MICPRCQYENVSNAAFCDECGARLEAACPNCGESNRRTAKFCRNCGHAINQTATTSPTPTTGATPPDTYLPKHLAEKILATRHTLEGERKQVTVLFADIRGSTRLVEELDPEEAQKIIDPVLHVMMDAVHRYEGTVNQVLGDGIMALFGAPLAREDHALRACYTALAMQEEMRRHREKLGQSEESGLQIGIGMNSGEVVVRSIDNDLNIEYSALGHTTHLAARMQELAGPGAIILTGTTLRDVEGFVEVKPLGAVQAKGVTRSVEAYELTGTTSAHTRVQAAASHGLTPLVGRRIEVEVFNKLVEQTTARRGQILAMVGEPGMGKSRLVHEFTRHQLPPGWLVLEGASVSYGKATAYFPLIEMLRRFFQIADGAGSGNIQERVVEHVLELDNTLKDTIPPILSLLGASPNEKHSPPSVEHDRLSELQDLVDMVKRFSAMEPQQKRRHTFDAVKRVFIRESQRRPLLIVFEDLHWIDSETQAFLDSMIESLPLTRIFLLVDYRPEYSHNWGDKTYYTQLRVDPLQSASAEELLQHLLGRYKDLAPVTQMLIKRTEGNPFFAEESVRSLVETGFLVGEKGAYRPGLRVDAIHIPSTVQNVLADRIDRLPLEEKHLLQTAAVIGVIVPVRLLSTVAGLPEGDLQSYLMHLQAAEFLYESNLYPELEYTFKHALTNEVAYGALLHDKRTALHAQTVHALEKIPNGSSHVQWDQLAHHAFLGELWDQAVTYLKQAGAQAVFRSSFRNAIFCYERALEASQHLLESTDTLRMAVDIRFELRNALFILGNFQQGFKYLEEARTFALKLNDRARLGMLFNFMTAFWNLEGNSEQAVTSGKQALEYTQGLQQIDLNVVAHYFLGVAYHNLGLYSEANEELKTALSGIGDRWFDQFGTTGIVSVICRSWLGRGLAQLGRFEEAMPLLEQAIQTAMEREHPYSLVYAYYAAGVLFLIKGQFDESIKKLESGLKVCEASNIDVQRPLVVSCLSEAYAYAGRLNEALDLLESESDHRKWVTGIGGQQLPFGKAMRMVWACETYLKTGRADEAESLAHNVLQVLNTAKDKGSEAWLLRILGDVQRKEMPRDPARALASYRAAFNLATELNMGPLKAHCHFGLGQLHTDTNEISLAGSELRNAIELYEDMAMNFWRAQAEAALDKLK